MHARTLFERHASLQYLRMKFEVVLIVKPGATGVLQGNAVRLSGKLPEQHHATEERPESRTVEAPGGRSAGPGQDGNNLMGRHRPVLR